MVILRFGLVTLFGIFFIVVSLCMRKSRMKIFNSSRYVRTHAIIKEIPLVVEMVGGESRTRWVVNAIYKIKNGQEITSSSQNSIHKKGDYKIGEKIEISYKVDEPEIFYLVDDKGNAESVEKGFLYFGISLCVLSLILMVVYSF